MVTATEGTIMARDRKTPRTELHSHSVTILGFNAHFSIRAFTERGLREPEIESGPWLELRGTLAVPIRRVQDIEISVYPREKLEVRTARPAHQTRRILQSSRRLTNNSD
jgi:hypothetical protein